MTQPVVYPVQAYAVDKFLHALATLTPRAIITGQELQSHKNVSEDYGFDKPSYSIMIEQGDQKFMLYLGKPTAPGDERYTQVVGSDEVDVISSDFVKVLPMDADEWRDTTFVRLDDLTFDRLTATSGGTTLKFQRGASNNLWNMTDPTPSPANSGRIWRLLNQLRTTRVTRFVPENPPPDLAAAGLQPPQLELTLAEGTNQVLDLQFGRSTNDDSDEYARVGVQGPVLIARGQVDQWREGPNAFRDRNLVSRANLFQDLEQGFSIDATGAGGSTNFAVRFTTNEPKLLYVIGADQLAYPVDGYKMQDFLSNLVTMQIAPPDASNAQAFAVKDRVVAADLGLYGLAETNLVRRYVLTAMPTNAAPTLLAQLDFGSVNTNAPGTMFVRRAHLADDRGVYAVRSGDFAKLPATALDLMEHRIWSFDASNVVQFTVTSNGWTRVLEHMGMHAWPPAPVPGKLMITDPVKEMSTESLVDNLGELEAQSWVGPAGPDLRVYGFDDKSPRIELMLRDGETPRTLKLDFGGEAPGGGRYASVMVRGQKWVFVYGASDWRKLNNWIWWPEP
jgi:hypothetical protein